MKSKRSIFLLTISLVLIISLVFTMTVTAADTSNSSDEILSEEKISVSLKNVLKDVPENSKQKIPVWIWFSDIDFSVVEDRVNGQLDFSTDEIAVETQTSQKALIEALYEASADDDNTSKDSLIYLMKEHMSQTEEQRELESERTNQYLSTRRKIISESYSTNNKRVISELKIPGKIGFVSAFTPSATAYLTKAEIKEVTYNNSVTAIYYLDNLDIIENSYENEKAALNVDEVYDNYGLTGAGVNILMNDMDYIRVDAPGYTALPKESNIRNIYNGVIYQIYNTTVLPTGASISNHQIAVADVLQNYAEDVYIYSTNAGNYSDIEWGILHCDINIVNISLSYTYSSTYEDDPTAKWIDALVSNSGVTVVASAGNSINQSSVSWPNVSSPAKGYNTIGAGAYITNGNTEDDYMHSFRYASVNGNNTVCYKPDMVVPADSTSRAAPTIASVISMIMQYKPSLKAEPEIIKAIVMASCHRKVAPAIGDTITEDMTSGLTQKQGAGAVDAYRAIAIVVAEQYGSKTINNSDDWQTADSINIEHTDDINVSISWLRKNTYSPNNITGGVCPVSTLGTVQELKLRLYIGNAPAYVASSERTNAGKQLAYATNLSPNYTYKIKVQKATDDNEVVKYGYAWSKKDFINPQVNIIGKTAVGKTITARVTNEYANPIQNLTVSSYIWQKSSDGINWTTIPLATNSSYTLTNNDWMNYIRCTAMVEGGTNVAEQSVIGNKTNLRVVLYGDVDLDGDITVVDATHIRRMLAHMETFTDEQMVAADVDGDGDVTIMDATYIQLYLNNSISSFPVENNP